MTIVEIAFEYRNGGCRKYAVLQAVSVLFERLAGCRVCLEAGLVEQEGQVRRDNHIEYGKIKKRFSWWNLWTIYWKKKNTRLLQWPVTWNWKSTLRFDGETKWSQKTQIHPLSWNLGVIVWNKKFFIEHSRRKRCFRKGLYEGFLQTITPLGPQKTQRIQRSKEDTSRAFKV